MDRTGNGKSEESGGKHLCHLIDNATSSPADALDVGLLASIKRLVRESDENIRLAFHLLVEKLKVKHSQVRYLAVLLADELFTRSKLFRSLLTNDFETFMVFTVGYRTNCPLPPPVNRATLLRSKSMEVLEKWNDSFGLHYQPLRLGYEYLKNTLHLQFPNLRQAAAQVEQQRKEREERSRALVLEKYETLKLEFPSHCLDIDQTLKQLEECFKILNTKGNRDDVSVQLHSDIHVTDHDPDIEDDEINSLRQVLDEAARQPPVLCETQDNKPVFDTVRDLCRLIGSQHSPAVQNWMSILMRVDTRDRGSHESLFKRVIDVRNQLSSIKTKCVELGIDISENDENCEGDDEIIWEEGGIDSGGALTSQCVQEALEVEEKEGILISNGVDKAQQGMGSATFDENRKHPRTELLDEAPVLPWGSYLDRWGAEHNVPVNQRGLQLESHWGRVEFDAVLPADKVMEMSLRASYYSPPKVEISPCLAPLKKGGLCQRKDLRVCPLHGPIVPRDSSGNPLPLTSDDDATEKCSQSKSSLCAESSSSLLPDRMNFVEEVEAKAEINVTRDEALMRKRMEKKLQAKRNREHNAEVLREASLANTIQGIGETLGEDLEKFVDSSLCSSKQQIKRAKASLKAMLQPKPTAKDRLAERLLSSRATDATIRILTRDEDVAYREAFANQW